jgi:uncharacterized membrane protein
MNDYLLKSNEELRAESRGFLSGFWGPSVLTHLIYSILLGAASGFAGIGNLIIGGPMDLGLATFFLSLKRNGNAKIEDLFKGFSVFESSVILYLVRMVFVVLWSLLLIIPGIVAALGYSMAIYILHDNPGLTGMEALARSKEMMDGYKGKLFSLYLSFIGWAFLCVFTFGIGYLWLAPYIKATEASFYENLKSVRGHTV